MKVFYFEIDWWHGNALLGALESILLPPGLQGNIIKNVEVRGPIDLSDTGHKDIRIKVLKECTSIYILTEVAPTDKTSFPKEDEYDYLQDPVPYIYPIVTSDSRALQRNRGFNSFINGASRREGQYYNLAYSHAALWIHSPTSDNLSFLNSIILERIPCSVNAKDYGLSTRHFFSYGEFIFYEDLKKHPITDYKLWIEMYDGDKGKAISTIYGLNLYLRIK